MSREIERKFLLTTLPPFVRNADFMLIEQGYIAISDERNEVRLRKANNQYTLTVKSDGKLVRQEYEIEISEKDFRKLWGSTKGRRLTKKRYLYREGTYLFEIDEYLDTLAGLLVVEVEFNSEKEANLFSKPSWFGDEITHVNFMKNKNLLRFSSTEELLDRYKNQTFV